jgi:ABC-type Mn2+/Zn2+ transport system ATPase subunit
MQVIEEQRVAGKIVLLATHDLVSASCACDCLCCVNERMVSYGPVTETYTVDNLAATYGGPLIMLGKSAEIEPAHTHHTGDHGHHHHTHEGVGSERN